MESAPNNIRLFSKSAWYTAFFCGNSGKSVIGTLAKRVNLPAIFLVNSSDI